MAATQGSQGFGQSWRGKQPRPPLLRLWHQSGLAAAAGGADGGVSSQSRCISLAGEYSRQIFRIAERMREFGPDLGMPYTKTIGGELFEIRAKGAEGIGRAFFCTQVGQRIVILHSFIKKTQAPPNASLP